MNKTEKIAKELEQIHEKHGSLKPDTVVDWAEVHPKSALYSRFEWDDTVDGRLYRLWQAREILVEVQVTIPDGSKQQVYVPPLTSRGHEGDVTLVSGMRNTQKHAAVL